MKNVLLLSFLCLCGLFTFAQAPDFPAKAILNETLLAGKTVTGSSVDTVLRQRTLPGQFTLEVRAKINSATGRGLDIEGRNAAQSGFRLSLNAANLQWTAPLSAANPWTLSPAGSPHTIRIAVKNDSAHIYQNGAYIQSRSFTTIKDIAGGVEIEDTSTAGPNQVPGWAGSPGNNSGTPASYGWSYHGTTVTNLFNTANAGSGVRYMDINASSGSNVHTYNGTAYAGRLLYIRWDNSATQNTVYRYPVMLEANTTYEFSWLHAYINNAGTGPRTMTVGIGKDTSATGRISSRTFFTSGTRVLNKEAFTFTSQEAGLYYLTVTGDWAIFSIGELSLNKKEFIPRFIFGKNYPGGDVDMQIMSVTYEEGAYAPAGIATGPTESVTVTGQEISYLPNFNTNFIVPGKTDLHLSGDYSPLVNSTVALNSNDAWLFFDNIKPSQVIANWLDKVTIHGASAKNNPNVRVAIYRNGTAIIPNGNLTSQAALEVFTQPGLAGDTQAYQVETYHNNLGEFDNKIRSFKLRRGYMATLANNADGSGYSRVFIANDSDLVLHSMPAGLDTTVSFIRVFKWDWVGKKGWAGGGAPVSQTNSTWFYDWNVGGIPTADYNYVTIRHNAGWPAWSDINNRMGISHLLGFNEPDQQDQANMSVEEAIRQWPEMMKSGTRIGAPAPANHFNTWLPTFMRKCDSLNYRVDYIAIHAYWNSLSPQNWYNRLKEIYDRYKRPIWITEWNNGANWTGEAWPSDPAQAFQKQLNDLRGILQVLDTASFIERYSIYNWVENKRAMVLADTLTPAGKYYAANKSGFAYNPQKAFVHDWKLAGPAITGTINSDNYFKVTLSWMDLNGELGAKYILERKIDLADTAFVTVQEFTGYPFGDTLSYVDDVYDKATYRIKAYDISGTQFVYSAPLDIIREAAPVAPTSLTGIALSSSQDSIKWNAGVNARSYNLKRSLNADGPFATIASRTTELQFEDDSLQAGTTYYYVVTSLNSAGESGNSSVLELRTKDLVAPGTVINPRIASGDTKAILTWDFQYDATYDITRSETHDGVYDTIATGINATRYEDTNRVNGNTYHYKVVARNGAGSSPETPVLSATPIPGQHLNISFDENAALFAEDAWGGYQATLAASAAWTAGYTNSAVKLDGTPGSYVSLAYSPVNDLNDFTITTWVKMDAVATWMRIFDLGSGTARNIFLTPQAGVSGGKSTVRFAIKNSGAEQQLNYSYAWPLNTWTHIAITLSGTAASLYINGELVATNPAFALKPSDIGITNQNYIGKSQYNDPLLRASVDEFRIYNRALTASELVAAMKQVQTITFAPFSQKMVDDPDFEAGASASSGLPVSYSSSNTNVAVVENGMIRIAGAGIAEITAFQPGDSLYAAAFPITRQLAVGKHYYVDADGDGLGAGEPKWFAVPAAPAGYADNNSDCDDTNPIPLTAAVPDVYAISPATTNKNTIYIGYGPSSLSVKAVPVGGRAPYQYLWSNSATTQAIQVTAPGTYTVTITDAKGCQATASVIIYSLNVQCGFGNNKVMVCHRGNTICVAYNAVKAHLKHGDRLGACDGAINSQLQKSAAEVIVYPNPVSSDLTIRITSLNKEATVQLFNALGSMLLSRKLTNNTSTISMKELPSGLYFVQIKNGQQISFTKIVKQ
jgi:hypothetical protein